MSASRSAVPFTRSAVAFVLLAPWLAPTAPYAGPDRPSAMKVIYGKNNAVAFVSADVDWRRFAEISLEGTRYEPIRKPRQGSRVAGMTRLAALVDDLLRVALGGWTETSAGTGTLAVRPVLREIDVSNVPLNVMSTAVFWWPADGGGATFDIELADGETGAYLGVIAARGGPPFWKLHTYFRRHGQARWFLNKSVREAARLMFELRSSETVPSIRPDAGSAQDLGQ